MDTTRSIHLHGAKGGVGTSVTAVLLAHKLSADLWVSGHTPAEAALMAEDHRAILGTTEAVQWEAAHLALTHRFGLDPVETAVVDRGVLRSDDDATPAGAQHLLVVDNKYLTLRRATSLLQSVTSDRWTGVILITHEGGVLTAQDITSVFGLPVVWEIPYDRSIGRLVDAGLLSFRMPRLNPPAAQLHH